MTDPRYANIVSTPRRDAAGLSIRTWVLIATLLATIPLLGFATWIVLALITNEHRDDTRELLQRTQAASLTVKRRFDRASSSLQALAVSPALRRGDYADVYAQAKDVMAANPDAVSISMVRADGQQLFTTAAPFDQAMPVSQAAALESALFANGEIVYTPVFTGSVTHRRVMAVSVPVRVDGRVVYSLRMSLPTEALTAALTDQILPADWTSAVIDPNGIIAGRSSDAARLVGRPATPSLQQAIASGAPCPYRTTTYAKVDLSSCASRVPATGWYVVIGVPTGEFERQVRDSLYKLMAAGLASAVLGAIGAFVVANRIRSEVKLLSRAEQGDVGPGAAPSTSIREIAKARQGMLAARRREDELEAMLTRAKHDSLTGLAGRELFREMVALDIALADAVSENVALLFMDLDGFKAINDRLGHDVGDQLLRKVADTIRNVIRSSDIAARLGGDEFVVYLRGASLDLVDNCCFVAQRLIDQIGALGDGLGCSVGAVVGPCELSVIPDLLSDADKLMMQAKSDGKGKFVLASRVL